MGKYQKKYEASRIFNVTLLDGRKLTLKNYPNKYQKRLLSAQISEDKDMIYKEIINVLNEQILEPVDFDLNQVPYFELHRVFLHLVANSYQNKLPITLSCGHETEVENEDREKVIVKCDGEVNSVIDLDRIEVQNIQDLVYECDNFNVKFRYPNFIEYIQFMEHLQIEDPSAKFLAIANLVNSCIYEISDDQGKDLFESLDKEDQEFIIDTLPPGVLSQAAMDLIKPFIIVAIPFVCPKCGHKKKIELKGLENFFR